MIDLSEFTTIIDIPVQWGDMDAYLHVNNVVYLSWVQSARVKYFADHFCDGDINHVDVGPILASQSCKYICPVVFPDVVSIGYRVNEVLEDRLICESHIYSKKLQRLVAIATNEIKPYSLTKLTKVSLSDEWKSTIARIDKRR